MKMFSWAICNAVSVACFAALAIHFEKWWIVLFAYFFIFTYKSGKEGDV